MGASLDEIAKLKAALAPFAQCAKTLDIPEMDGYPFDDPDEVLWAGETGTLTVRDFRAAQAALVEFSQ